MVPLFAWLAACGTPGQGGAPPAATPTGGEAPAAAAGQVVAKVGPHGVVTDLDFQEAALRTPPDGSQYTLAQRKDILEDLVEQELLFQEAFAQGLYRDPKVKRALVQQLLRNEVLDKLKEEPLQEEELRAYYDAHRTDFQIPPKAQVRRIFLRVDAHRTEADALAQAREFERQIRADPSKFRDIAQQFSEDAYKRRGGDMGYLDRVPDSPHPPELLERAFSAPLEQITAPFVAGGGVNLIVVAARRDGVERTFEQVKGTVIRTVRSARFDEASAAYVRALAARTPIERPTDEALASMPLEGRLGHDEGAPRRAASGLGPADPEPPAEGPEEEQ